jgi:hypothetical protein
MGSHDDVVSCIIPYTKGSWMRAREVGRARVGDGSPGFHEAEGEGSEDFEIAQSGRC